jgi:hypothetical protein
LFLACAFLPHVWTYILAFQDFSGMIVRTGGVWGAIGVLSYGLVFVVLLESIFVFAVTAALGCLVSTRWPESRRIALLALLVFVTALWAMYAQAYFAWSWQLPGPLFRLLVRLQPPLPLLYALALIPAAATLLAPTWLILRNERIDGLLQGLLERIHLLSGVYLAVDALALLVVVVRNL